MTEFLSRPKASVVALLGRAAVGKRIQQAKRGQNQSRYPQINHKTNIYLLVDGFRVFRPEERMFKTLPTNHGTWKLGGVH